MGSRELSSSAKWDGTRKKVPKTLDSQWENFKLFGLIY